jgi:hypothetical protein
LTNGKGFLNESGSDMLQRLHELGVCQARSNLMAQASNVLLGRFDDLIRQCKAPPAPALIEAFYETGARRDFAPALPFNPLAASCCLCQTDDGCQEALGMGPATGDEGL